MKIEDIRNVVNRARIKQVKLQRLRKQRKFFPKKKKIFNKNFVEFDELSRLKKLKKIVKIKKTILSVAFLIN